MPCRQRLLHRDPPPKRLRVHPRLFLHRKIDLRFVPPAIALPDQNETWPAWSPDGRYLYYCSAARLPIEQFRQIRYDLMRISYDIDRDQWGQPEVLLSSKETGLSACEPTVSPDGRLLLFCLCNYGNFPVYQPSSDLCVMDLATRQCLRPAINSDQAESWPCWSSNGRWIVFSSKRLDGLFARPFFSYVAEQGQFSKPFLLPQASPEFYDSFVETFNRLELVQGPIQVTESELARAVPKPRKLLTPKGETRLASPEQTAAPDEGYQRAPP
jgi:WD40-like Beta Propeller Repeat